MQLCWSLSGFVLAALGQGCGCSCVDAHGCGKVALGGMTWLKAVPWCSELPWLRSSGWDGGWCFSGSVLGAAGSQHCPGSTAALPSLLLSVYSLHAEVKF